MRATGDDDRIPLKPHPDVDEHADKGQVANGAQFRHRQYHERNGEAERKHAPKQEGILPKELAPQQAHLCLLLTVKSKQVFNNHPVKPETAERQEKLGAGVEMLGGDVGFEMEQFSEQGGEDKHGGNAGVDCPEHEEGADERAMPPRFGGHTEHK